MTTVYKVVRRRRDGKLASAIIKRGKLLRIYKPQEPTHSVNGMKLLAFDNASSANCFMPCNVQQGKAEVWEALATGVGSPPKCLAYPFQRGFSSVLAKAAWEGLLDWSSPNAMSSPASTVACDSITLIKRVDGAE